MAGALTRNLGHRRSGEAWLRSRLADDGAPALVFAQEVLPSLVEAPPDGYRVITGRGTAKSAVGRTSALLIRDGIGAIAEGAPQYFGALGTYVATASLRPDGTEVWLISAHASPSPVPAEKRRPQFRTRSCETEPWWADAFVAELLEFASHGFDHVVIAGDLNQARAYDAATGHTCGGELLDAIAASGFVDATLRDWEGVERPTRLNPDYHLDRVWVSSEFAERVTVHRADLVHDDDSDHAAVEFTVAL